MSGNFGGGGTLPVQVLQDFQRTFDFNPHFKVQISRFARNCIQMNDAPFL